MKFGTEVVIKGGKVLWGTVPPTPQVHGPKRGYWVPLEPLAKT